jgi:hypothetical protein
MAKYNKRHGGAYDRGAADAYYGRTPKPHYFKGNTYNSEKVHEPEMTYKEVMAYLAGYEEQIKSGEFKDYR